MVSDIPPACMLSLRRLVALQDELRRLQQELRYASPGQKPEIVERIRELAERLADAQQAYSDCLANNPLPPILASNLSNPTQHVDLDVRVHGLHVGQRSYDSAPTFAVEFSPLRETITVTEYSVAPFLERRACVDDATVSLVGTPQGRVEGPHITIPMTFHIRHSNFLYGSSDVTITLTTSGPAGQAMDSAGHLVLVGSGNLDGGALDGSPISMRLEGSFDPAP
jgi:hypothetical protein